MQVYLVLNRDKKDTKLWRLGGKTDGKTWDTKCMISLLFTLKLLLVYVIHILCIKLQLVVL